MRLVCPKCAAQYEVNANAIPDEGRDVQCASCGNTWFQASENAGPDVRVEPQVTADDTEFPPVAHATATPVDPAVLDILRQEAELEANTREAEMAPAPVVEPAVEPSQTMPEQTPDAPNDAHPAAEETVTVQDQQNAPSAEPDHSESPEPSAPENLEPAQGAKDDAKSASRPAPEQDYKAAQTQQVAPEQPVAAPAAPEIIAQGESADAVNAGASRANRFGFYLAVFVFLALFAAYALRGQIAAALPASEPYLSQYAALVDGARLRLADGVQTLVQAVKNLF